METNLNETLEFKKYLDESDLNNLDFIKSLINKEKLIDLYISDTSFLNGKYRITITYKNIDYYLNNKKSKQITYSIASDKYKVFFNIYTQLYTIIKAKKFGDLETYDYMLKNLYYYNKANLKLIINILDF